MMLQVSKGHIENADSPLHARVRCSPDVRCGKAVDFICDGLILRSTVLGDRRLDLRPHRGRRAGVKAGHVHQDIHFCGPRMRPVGRLISTQLDIISPFWCEHGVSAGAAVGSSMPYKARTMPFAKGHHRSRFLRAGYFYYIQWACIFSSSFSSSLLMQSARSGV